MKASVLCDIMSRAKMEWHEAAGLVAFHLARDAISHRTRAFIISVTVLEHGHTHEQFRFRVQIVCLHFIF